MNTFSITFIARNGKTYTENFECNAQDRDSAAMAFNRYLFEPVIILAVEWVA